MVLEPFTALGLASNVVQFVDFAFKLVSESQAIYKSGSGASVTARDLEVITADLDRLVLQLANAKGTSAAGVGTDLKSIAAHCHDTAEELLSALVQLRSNSPTGKWKSFLQALKEIWRKDKIEELARRLERFQKQINSHLLFILKYRSLNISVPITMA